MRQRGFGKRWSRWQKSRPFSAMRSHPGRGRKFTGASQPFSVSLHHRDSDFAAALLFWATAATKATVQLAQVSPVAECSHYWPEAIGQNVFAQLPAHRYHHATAAITTGAESRLAPQSSELPLDFCRFSGCADGTARTVAALLAGVDAVACAGTVRSGAIYGSGQWQPAFPHSDFDG